MREASPFPDAPFDRRAIPPLAREAGWVADDGALLRRIDWPGPAGAPRGSLLFLPGRGDTYEKYLESFEDWRRAGWCVSAADWRGQAGSGRLGTDAITGHVADFAVWIDDLAALWRDWKAATPAPHALIGHSMGGHLVLRALAERRVDPAALVLSAPMLGIGPALVPLAVLHAVARLFARLGDPRRPAWKWEELPGVPAAARGSLLTHDAARYADEMWWREARPELKMGAPSWGWLAAAFASLRFLERPGLLEAVTTPVLILAMQHDRLVNFAPIARAAGRLPRAELVLFGREAYHEILRESDAPRTRALAAIDDFLTRST